MHKRPYEILMPRVKVLKIVCNYRYVNSVPPFDIPLVVLLLIRKHIRIHIGLFLARCTAFRRIIFYELVYILLFVQSYEITPHLLVHKVFQSGVGFEKPPMHWEKPDGRSKFWVQRLLLESVNWIVSVYSFCDHFFFRDNFLIWLQNVLRYLVVFVFPVRN